MYIHVLHLMCHVCGNNARSRYALQGMQIYCPYKCCYQRFVPHHFPNLAFPSPRTSVYSSHVFSFYNIPSSFFVVLFSTLSSFTFFRLIFMSITHFFHLDSLLFFNIFLLKFIASNTHLYRFLFHCTLLTYLSFFFLFLLFITEVSLQSTLLQIHRVIMHLIILSARIKMYSNMEQVIIYVENG